MKSANIMLGAFFIAQKYAVHDKMKPPSEARVCKVTIHMHHIKQKLLSICIHLTKNRIQEIVDGIGNAQESIENETKSSAGDKYETSREMIQQDLNRYQDQLTQAKRDLSILQQITNIAMDRVALGALVITEKAMYFLTISIGKIQFEEKEYWAISPSSPIGRLLIGKTVGDVLHFNGMQQQVLAIY